MRTNRSYARCWVPVVAALLLTLPAHASMPTVESLMVQQSQTQWTVTFEAVGATDRPLEGVDILVAIGTGTELEPLDALLAGIGDSNTVTMDEYGVSWQEEPTRRWQTAGVWELEAGRTTLRRRTRERLYLIRRIPRLGPGQRVKVSFDTPPALGVEGEPRAQVVSWREIQLRSDALTTLPVRGVVGWSILNRSLGIEWWEDDLLLATLKKNAPFVAEVRRLASDTASTADPVMTIAVSLARRLLGHLDTRSYLKLLPDWWMKPIPIRSALDDLEAVDQHAGFIARRILVSGYGSGDLSRMALLEPLDDLDVGERKLLARSLGALLSRGPKLFMEPTFRNACSRVLFGLKSIAEGDARELLDAAATLGVPSAFYYVFSDRSQFAYAYQVLGAKRLEAIGISLGRNGIVGSIFEILGDENRSHRRIARSWLLSAVDGELAVDTALEERHRPTTGSLDAKIERLTGALLSRLARTYENQAESVRQHGGDCLRPLEKAREEVHPEVWLSPGLVAECTARRAAIRVAEGKLDEARALLDTVGAGHRDSKTAIAAERAWSLAHARGLLNKGDLVRALEQVARIDPTFADPDSVALMADIESAQGRAAQVRGELDKARGHYAEARRLDPSRPTPDELLADPTASMRLFVLSMTGLFLLIGGVALVLRVGGAARRSRRFSATASHAETVVVGGRRMVVADHGVLLDSPEGTFSESWSRIDEVLWVPSVPGAVLESVGGTTMLLRADAATSERLQRMLERRLHDVGLTFRVAEGSASERFAEVNTQATSVSGAHRRLTVVCLVAALVAGGIVGGTDVGTGLDPMLRIGVGVALGVGIFLVGREALIRLLPRIAR